MNLVLKIILDISKGFPITLILRMKLKDSTTLLKNTQPKNISNNYKKLNYNETRIKVINYYNNKIHLMLGVSPNTAAKITNIEKINNINAIKTKEFSKINNKINYIKDGSFDY